MEKRSRRRARDLVAQAASQGLSENEIGCARISMMARSKNAPFKGRIQKRKTLSLRCSFRLATHGRSIPTSGLMHSSMVASFDHLVGIRKQRRWDGEAESLCCF